MTPINGDAPRKPHIKRAVFTIEESQVIVKEELRVTSQLHTTRIAELKAKSRRRPTSSLHALPD